MRHFFIIVTLFLVLAPLQAFADDGIGVVRTLTGKAIIIRNDQEITAKKDLVIMRQDAIETGKDGSIGITFKDNTVFSLGPDSAIEIQDYVYDSGKFKGSMNVKMDRGTMTAVSGDIPKGSPGAMKIKTPTAVMAVRGTRFVVKVEPND